MSARISKIITVVLVVAVLVLACGAIGAVLRDRGGSSADSELTVTYNDTEYKPSEDIPMFVMPGSGRAEFGINGVKSYTVSITANAEFDYTVDGNTYAFAKEDLTTAILSAGEILKDKLVIDLESATVCGALRRIWGDEANIEFPAAAASEPYLIAFKSGVQEVRFILDCPPWSPNNAPGSDITLDPDRIDF